MNLTEQTLKNHLQTADFKVFDLCLSRDPKNGKGLKKGFLKTNKHGCFRMCSERLIVEGSLLRFELIHKKQSSLHSQQPDPQPQKLILTTDISAKAQKEQIKELFSAYGPVESLLIFHSAPENHCSMVPLRYIAVLFKEDYSVKKAMEAPELYYQGKPIKRKLIELPSGLAMSRTSLIAAVRAPKKQRSTKLSSPSNSKDNDSQSNSNSSQDDLLAKLQGPSQNRKISIMSCGGRRAREIHFNFKTSQVTDCLLNRKNARFLAYIYKLADSGTENRNNFYLGSGGKPQREEADSNINSNSNNSTNNTISPKHQFPDMRQLRRQNGLNWKSIYTLRKLF